MFAYNGIDLAYFNQVFWNTIHGRPFVQSIHPHLSLGDHAEFAILLIAPFYALLPDPRTLLVCQAIALAVPAYVVWRIAKRRLAGSEGAGKGRSIAPLVIALAYLLNPLVHNIALYEFHILPFALAPLFMALLAYDEERKGRFILWSLVALLVREDVSMVIAMVGVLAWMERKPLWWRVTPVVLGAAWFLASMRLIAHFAPDGSYKYRIYYAWLGSTPGGMLVGAITNPIRVLAHVVTIPNLEMAIGFLMPLLFLPLLKPKRLVLALGPLLQIILGAPGGGELILDTHYATLFLPALFLATIDGLSAWPTVARRLASVLTPVESRRLAYAFLLAAAFYGAVTLGPLPAVASAAFRGSDASGRTSAAKKVIAMIPPDASVAASYALLPALSSRQRLTSLHYVFLGVTQFAEAPYKPPNDIEYAALDAEDLLTYRTQFLKTAWAAPHYAGGVERIKAVAGEADIAFLSPFVLYKRDAKAIDNRVPKENNGDSSTAASPHLSYADAGIVNDAASGERYLLITAYWQVPDAITDDLTVRTDVPFTDGTAAITRQPYVAWPPLSFRTTDGYISETRVPLADGRLPRGDITLSLVRENAAYTLDGIRSASRRVTGEEALDIVTLFLK